MRNAMIVAVAALAVGASAGSGSAAAASGFRNVLTGVDASSSSAPAGTWPTMIDLSHLSHEKSQPVQMGMAPSSSGHLPAPASIATLLVGLLPLFSRRSRRRSA